MKFKIDHSLFLGLVASLLLALGFVGIVEKIDAVMDHTNKSEDQLKVAGPPAPACIDRANDNIG